MNGNYNIIPKLFASLPMWRFFLNTFVYAAVTIVGVCLSSSLVAYGFSRLRWPGRNAVFYLMLMTLILPFVCTLIPLILGDYTTNWSWVMAGATAATVPIVVLFFLTQRTFVQGITLTGTKG